MGTNSQPWPYSDYPIPLMGAGEGGQRVITQPYGWAIAEGYIPNHHNILKIGFNGDIDNTLETVWPVGGQYVPPTQGMQMELVSSSTDDDGSPVGIGARTAHLHYLNSKLQENEEILILDGTTPVLTTSIDIYRVQGFHVQTVGSSGVAVGNIDLRHTSDTPIYARILAGEARAQNTFWTVPANHTLFIACWHASSSAAASGHYTNFSLKTTSHNGENTTGVFITQDKMLLQDAAGGFPFTSPIKVPSGAEVKITAVSDGATANVIVAAHWEGWYEDNEFLEVDAADSLTIANPLTGIARI